MWLTVALRLYRPLALRAVPAQSGGRLGFHLLTQDAVDLGLVARPLATQPVEHVHIQTQRNRLLARLVKPTPHCGGPVGLGRRGKIHVVTYPSLDLVQPSNLSRSQLAAISGAIFVHSVSVLSRRRDAY